MLLEVDIDLMAKELRKRGYSALILNQHFPWSPRLLIGIDGFNYLLGIVEPANQRPTGCKTWLLHWRGQIQLITCTQDALDFIEERRCIQHVESITRATQQELTVENKE